MTAISKHQRKHVLMPSKHYICLGSGLISETYTQKKEVKSKAQVVFNASLTVNKD